MLAATKTVPSAKPLPRLCAPLRIVLSCAILLAPANAAQMPYNPTSILRNGSTVYVFRPAADSASQFELASIDIGSALHTSDLSFTTLYPALPFLDASKQLPFSAVLNDGGNMTIYTGDCTSGASGGHVWNFMPDPSEKNGNGTWRQQGLTFDQAGKHTSDMGPKYLSAGVAFSTVVNRDSMDDGTYFFGGMCPSQAGNSGDWQSNANYSNHMITLEPPGTTSPSPRYKLDISTSRGPPIAEAGFTLTGLSPSYSNRSDGVQTQQQNFVLIGGHTSAAFINTSQVALFSLPQQGWTFVPVKQPDTSRTDLAIRRDVKNIEPRSGHSTVLSPDGQRLIVFGGWIGDTSTPADPQFAVLNVGDGYGGEGDWQWSVPSTSGSSIPDGSGIYGHGAVMLPGGVMMITGGYSTNAPKSGRRRAVSGIDRQAMFLNVSSYTWTTDYSPPSGIQSDEAKNGALATTRQKAGLGAGLGIGMAVVLSLMCFYIWYTRNLKKQREFRESQLQEMSLGAHRYTLSPGFDDRGGPPEYAQSSEGLLFYSHTAQRTSGWGQTKGRDAERTGLLVEIPSPTRGLRRSSGGKTGPPMPRYDERRVRGSGNIHPIDEEEEQESEVAERVPLTSHPEMVQRPAHRGHSIIDDAPILNPFVDQHHSKGDDAPLESPQYMPDESRDDYLSWQAVAVAGAHVPRDASPDLAGRTSPTKSSERTGSNLSERSARSNLSSHSGAGSIGRSASMRSTAILNLVTNANAYKSSDPSPVEPTSRSGSALATSADPRTRSFTSVRSFGRPSTANLEVAANADTDSFTTARSSFMALQAEGEALLGGNPERGRPGTSSTSNGSNSQSHGDTDGSMTRSGTVTAATSTTDRFSRRPGGGRERRMSWLGSVRRALARSTSSADRTRSLTTATTQYETYTDNPSPTEDPSSSTAEDHHKSFPSANTPRRAASDASFWRSKRGKQDWLEEEMDPNDPRAKWKRNAGDDWGTPEDLALAEKERLRREWRERGSLLINLADDDVQMPTPRTPIGPSDLGRRSPAGGERDRPRTPVDEDDWDVEAAVERRVVQVMFTVPKSKLRVVNADVDRSSILSLPRENSKDNIHDGDPSSSASNPNGGAGGTPNRVKDLAGRFEQLNSPTSASPVTRTSPRASPIPSPAPSIRSMKLRGRNSAASLPKSGDADR